MKMARGIAGHAGIHFPGSSEDEIAERVQDVLDNPDSLKRNLGPGRTAVYDDGTVVVTNTNVPYGGTAYSGGFEDFLKVK